MEFVDGKEYYFTIYDTFKGGSCFYVLDIKIAEKASPDYGWAFKTNDLIFYKGPTEKRYEYSRDEYYMLMGDDKNFLTPSLQRAYRNIFVLLFRGY